MMKIALLVAVVGLCNAAPKAESCCTPDQWEGTIDVFTGSVTDGTPSENEMPSMVSYDFKNKQLSATIQIQQGSMTMMNRTIFKYKTQMMYNYNIETLDCTVMEFDLPFQKACVPPGATPAGEFFYGLGSNSLKAAAFKFMVPNVGLSGYYVIAQDGCIPITEVVFGKLGESSLLSTTEFVDITDGIKDPSVFDPPATCESPKAKANKKAMLKRGALGLPKF